MENMENPVEEKGSSTSISKSLEREDRLNHGNKSILELIADSASDTFEDGILEVEEPTELLDQVSPKISISSIFAVTEDNGNNPQNVSRSDDVSVYSTSSDEVLSAFDFGKQSSESDDSYDTINVASPNTPKYSLLFGQVYQKLTKRPSLFASILLEPQNKQLLDDFLQGFQGTTKIIPWTVRAGLKHWSSKVPFADMDQLQQLSTKHFPYMKTTRPLVSIFDDENDPEESMVELTKAVMNYVKKTEENSPLNQTVNSITSFMNFLCDLENGEDSGENSGETSRTPSTTRQRNVREAFQESFLYDTSTGIKCLYNQRTAGMTQQSQRKASLLHRIAGFREFPGSFSSDSRSPNETLENPNIQPNDVNGSDRSSLNFPNQHSYVRPGLMPYYNTPTVLPSNSNTESAGIMPGVSCSNRAVCPIKEILCPKSSVHELAVIDLNENVVDQGILQLQETTIQEPSSEQESLAELGNENWNTDQDNCISPIVQSSVEEIKTNLDESLAISSSDHFVDIQRVLVESREEETTKEQESIPAKKVISDKEIGLPVNKTNANTTPVEKSVPSSTKGKGKIPSSKTTSFKFTGIPATTNQKQLSSPQSRLVKTVSSKTPAPSVKFNSPSERNALESKPIGKCLTQIPIAVTPKASATSSNYAALHRRKVAQKSTTKVGTDRPQTQSGLRPPATFRNIKSSPGTD